MLEGIAKYLQSQGIVTFDSTGANGDAFIEVMPDSPSNAVAFMSSGGPEEPGVRHSFDTRTFQVLVRGGVDPRPPRSRAEQIYSALQGLTGVTLDDGTYVVAIGGIQSGPIRMQPDVKDRHRFSLNFWVRLRVPTANRV